MALAPFAHSNYAPAEIGGPCLFYFYQAQCELGERAWNVHNVISFLDWNEVSY